MKKRSQSFYEDIKDTNFEVGMFAKPVVFFPRNELIDQYNADSPTWEIEHKGSYVYHQIMAKKFINYYANPNAGIGRLLNMIVLCFAFLIW